MRCPPPSTRGPWRQPARPEPARNRVRVTKPPPSPGAESAARGPGLPRAPSAARGPGPAAGWCGEQGSGPAGLPGPQPALTAGGRAGSVLPARCRPRLPQPDQTVLGSPRSAASRPAATARDPCHRLPPRQEDEDLGPRLQRTDCLQGRGDSGSLPRPGP